VNVDDDGVNAGSRWEVPAAFYRDDSPPVPPPGDPHRSEFYPAQEVETLPDWMLIGMPIVMLIVFALHGVVAIILLWLMH
jgi:hypothetical protein